MANKEMRTLMEAVKLDEKRVDENIISSLVNSKTLNSIINYKDGPSIFRNKFEESMREQNAWDDFVKEAQPMISQTEGVNDVINDIKHFSSQTLRAVKIALRLAVFAWLTALFLSGLGLFGAIVAKLGAGAATHAISLAVWKFSGIILNAYPVGTLNGGIISFLVIKTGRRTGNTIRKLMKTFMQNRKT